MRSARFVLQAARLVLGMGLGAAAFGAVVAGLGAPAAAQQPANEPDPVLAALGTQVSEFLEAVSEGQAPTAYQDFLAGSPLLEKTDALRQLVEKTGEIESRFGRYRATEQIAAKRVGADLVFLTYLYKCEELPVVWHFTFYRAAAAGENSAADQPWRVIAVRFDSDLAALEP